MAAPIAQYEPRSGFFISRGDGFLVPLIEADRLPEGIGIMGIPRYLSSAQTKNMRYLGVVHGPTQICNVNVTSAAASGLQPLGAERETSIIRPWEAPKWRSVDHPDTGPLADSQPNTAPTCSNRKAPMNTNPNSSSPAPDMQPPLAKATPKQRKHRPAPETRDPHTSVPRRPLPPSGTEPDLSKKKYCTHWIRTGECDYTQQGCMYKHIMPDAATLRSIGFRATPTWWRAQQRQRTPKPDSSRTNSASRANPRQRPPQQSKRPSTPDTSSSASARVSVKFPPSDARDAAPAAHDEPQVVHTRSARRASSASEHELHLVNIAAPPLQPASPGPLCVRTQTPRPPLSPSVICPPLERDADADAGAAFARESLARGVRGRRAYRARARAAKCE